MYTNRSHKEKQGLRLWTGSCTFYEKAKATEAEHAELDPGSSIPLIIRKKADCPVQTQRNPATA
jgi:hypothetical protein